MKAFPRQKAMGALAIALVSCVASANFEIFVAPGGDDSNPGTREKPVATPEGARDALRKARAANGGTRPSGGATVEFADGTYLFEKPLALEKQDSGAEGAPVVWRAANRGKAVFSGAFVPAGWKVVDDPAVIALLPEQARGKVRVAEFPAGMEIPGFRGGGQGVASKLQEIPFSLFQGEMRLEPARWPNEGFAHTGANIGEIQKNHDSAFCKSGVFKFLSPRLDRWTKEPELWAYGLWCYEWADAKTRVLAIDPAAGTMSVDPTPIFSGIKENAQFYVFNAIGEIDHPGEWVIDRASRRLYLWPAGEFPVSIASAPGLISAQDVSDVTLDGFVFEYARTTAVTFKKSSRVKVLSSVFRHTSCSGVAIWSGRDCSVQGCDMYDLGEGGIILDGGDFKTLVPGNNVADNNHIRHYGQVVPNYRPGVRLHGVGNRCTHNLIHHTRHQAVSFGGNDHYIGYNVMHDCCMYNEDAGVIYCCQRDWTKRGTVIERNIIHMTGKRPRTKNTHAIYLDDYSSGIVVRGNIINRASDGVSLGGGQDCELYGNVLMNCRSTAVSLGSRGIDSFARRIAEKGRESSLFRVLEGSRALFEGPLWKSRYPNMMRVFDFPDAQHAHDAHFNRISNNVCIASGPIIKGNWKNISGTCVVTNNLNTADDPGFEDYFHFGWELKPGAARDLVGPLHLDEIGLYESPCRVSPAVKFAADVTPPRPLRPEYDPAMVRIDLDLAGNLPEGVDVVASGCQNCAVPKWGKGKRIVAGFGEAATNRWEDYSFSFVPAFDARLLLITMGARGEKTVYDDIRVEGAKLRNGGFEDVQGWNLPRFSKDDYRVWLCNLAQPWGIIDSSQAGVPAAEGDKMACGSDLLNFTQWIAVKKGVPVTITFKARALPESSAR